MSMNCSLNVDGGGVNAHHETFPDAVHSSTHDDVQTVLMNHSYADIDDVFDTSYIAWQMDVGVDAHSFDRKKTPRDRDEDHLD